MSKFVQADRNQRYLLPPDLRDWVPDDDLVHFVIEACERVELTHFRYNDVGTGSAQYHPQMMLALLIYCYANGLFSSRRIERATYRDIAVRYLTADTHPDHDTICKFRRENFDAIAEAFLQVLLMARQLKLLKLGNVSLDGTKIDANANKRRSLRYDRAGELSDQLQGEIDDLLKQAEQADNDDDDDDHLPRELSHHEQLKQKLDKARAELEDRAKARAADEREVYERKVKVREQRSGRQKGQPPTPPSSTPKATEQINLTDPDSALMRKSKQSEFRQGYNAQAAVDADGSMLVVSAHVTGNASDRHQLVAGVQGIPELLGRPKRVLADNGYADGNQVATVQAADIEVLVATGRERGRRRFDFRPQEPQKDKPATRSTWIKDMNAALEKPENQSIYRLRQQTVEPTFGIIKSVMGFRQFLLRGIDKVTGEWQLVTLAYNCKRLHQLCKT